MWVIWFLILCGGVEGSIFIRSGVDLSDFGAELFILSLCPIFENVV